MEKTIFTQVSPVELADLINEGIKSELKKIINDLHSDNNQDELLTRKQTSELLSISLVCLHDWCNKNILKPYKMGNRTYFKRSELLETLSKSNEL